MLAWFTPLEHEVRTEEGGRQRERGRGGRAQYRAQTLDMRSAMTVTPVSTLMSKASRPSSPSTHTVGYTKPVTMVMRVKICPPENATLAVTI
jgi:hypothetical protein